MNRKTMKKKSYLFNSTLVMALFTTVLTMGACAENDLENRNSEGDKGAVVSFEIKDVQEAVLADVNPDSRVSDAATFNHQLTELGLTSADLESQVLEAQSPAGMEACLVENTIPGINPVQHDPQTRATVTKTLTADFSTLGYRGTSATNISSIPDWFYNARTKSNGELYDKLLWGWSKRFARFFAIFPEVKNTYSKIKLSPATHVGNPYVEFEVEPNVLNQKDLMTACSGEVEYQTRGFAPNTSLAFRHALTAVHFAIGQNLWAGQIMKIEISGAINKGTYTLSSDPTQPGTWTLGTTTGTFTLNGININTAVSPGSVITDDNGNFTFFMIPQEVTGKNIYVDIYFYGGKTIHVPLKGKWLPGTTKTYTLSNKQSNWQYVFQVVGKNNTIAYDATDAGTYYVRSFRQFGGIQIPIKWKIVSYQESTDGGLTWLPETTEKPDWLTNLSMTEGPGGDSWPQGTATVKKATIIDKAAARNAQLKLGPKGDATNYYDLSTHNIKGVTTLRNTANSYVISHPGFYKLPLVYGNAIKDGSTNLISYKPSVTVTGDNLFLQNFKDHENKDITDPWIEKTNGGAYNGLNLAKLIWSDEKDLVHNLAISHDASGDAYLQFEVKEADIKMGNAVVAVMKDNWRAVWSWHLWFTSEDVLNTTEVTNFQNNKYNFTNENLGWKYTQWLETTYTQPRQVKVKIQQTSGNDPKNIGYITITQNPGFLKRGYGTHYQWGRKDAFPIMNETPSGYKPIPGYLAENHYLDFFIQYPGALYWPYRPSLLHRNRWSTNGNGIDIIKTVYDPSPAGFKVPPVLAFTGFTKNGENLGTYEYIPLTPTELELANIANKNDFTWFQNETTWHNNNYGWNFYNKITNPDATLWFPKTGGIFFNGTTSITIYPDRDAFYWEGALAGYASPQAAHRLSYNFRRIKPKDSARVENTAAVRPIAE